MATPAEKAAALMRQAEKKATSGGGFFGMFSNPQDRYHEAAGLFSEAAIQYKIGKMWKEAANAYMRSAEMQTKAELPHEAASCYSEAATVLKKVSNEEAVLAMERAADTYQQMGRFAMSAKQYKNMAEMYETQLVNLERALHFYREAVEAYEADDSSTSADKLKLKVAQLQAQQEQFDEASQLFEEVAGRMMESNTLKFSAKEQFMRAALCRLCMGDAIATKRAVDNYAVQCPYFADSREHKMLQAVTEAMSEGDVEAFQEAVREFDQVQKLDNWMTNLLLRVKRGMEGEEDIL